MNCTKTVKEYSEAAGRKVEFCRELGSAADGTLGGFGLSGVKGIVMSGGKLKWWTGVPIGAAAHYLSQYVTQTLEEKTTTDNALTRFFDNGYASGLPGLAVGAVLAIFKKTRSAGLTAIGTGAALSVARAIMDKTGTTGLPVAQVGRAPVQILTGSSGRLGLPVAEELSRAPVQVLTGSGVFGASIGTNFTRR